MGAFHETGAILAADRRSAAPGTDRCHRSRRGRLVRDIGRTVADAAISTENLTESARYSTGLGTRPDSLAVAGGTLWFGYGTAGAGGIGSVDGSGTVTSRQDSGTWTAPPTLATTPTPSGVLAAAVQTGDTSAFVTYRAEGGALTRQAAKALPVPDLSDFAVTADGLHLAVSSPAYPRGDRYGTSDLAADGRFAMPVGPGAVAVAPDGTMADGVGDHGFESFPETGEGYYHEYDFGYPLRLAAHGLAWAPDGSRLYTVGVDASGGTPTLRTTRDPETAWVHLYGSSSTTPLAPGLLHWRHRRHRVGGLRHRPSGRTCRISATIAPG
ncbi:hypothetical protein OG568_29430 [Streptomyces sp. NBC_01450]|uniref:hypothetical protein n=1 Tax=Streptomyces sp. NBC_01450 TaxID=2903871 RepID=UPI002E37D36D|nr:hypothetical protein [Streptomyces sp. NBC_01450]